MISESEALDRILASLSPLPPADVPLLCAHGRFVSGDVFSPADLPRFDQSAMDGYALRAADAQSGATLNVSGEQPAGPDRGLTVPTGAAIRIFTGAPLPAGADSVVMQEDVECAGTAIIFRTDVEPGEFVRPRGSDVCAGQIILRAGDVINAQRIGLLATLGVESITVHGSPRVSLIGSGNELRPPGASLAPGEIYESNTAMLQTLLEAHGFSVSSRVTAPDDRAEITQAFDAAADSDAVIFTGGVSVGDHDHVPALLHERGVSVDFWRVAVRPGKPFLFGKRGPLAVFGLPGNPVSTFVTAILFVLPALRRLAGADLCAAVPRRTTARLAVPAQNPGDRPHYLRGRLIDGAFTPARLQESHALASLAASNALARLAPGASLAADDLIVVFPLD